MFIEYVKIHGSQAYLTVNIEYAYWYKTNKITNTIVQIYP